MKSHKAPGNPQALTYANLKRRAETNKALRIFKSGTTSPQRANKATLFSEIEALST